MKRLNDLISVIIPVFNAEKWLNRCVDSVVNQTYQNIEIILVDDGSTDGSAKICDDYAIEDPRIIVIHQQNGGVSRARNTGLQNCTGKYISFIDSDDYVSSSYISYMYEKICEYSSPVCTVEYSYNEKEEQRIDEEIKLVESINYRFNLSYSHITICGCMFARSLLETNGEVLTFSEDIIRCEDILFMANIVRRASTILATNQRLYFVSTENSASLTKSKNATKIVESISMWLTRMKETLNGEYIPVYKSIYDWIPVNYVAMINAFCDTEMFHGKAYKKAKKMIWKKLPIILLSKDEKNHYKWRLLVCAISPRIYCIIRKKFKEG